MVPLMAKGNNTARTAHIAMNITNLALFTWQIPTGLEIVRKCLHAAFLYKVVSDEQCTSSW